MNTDKKIGLVSGVCYDPVAKTIIAVFDQERAALNSYALPGGMIEPGETPFDAMAREWKEEVGARIKSCKRSISRSRKGGEYNHYFFRIELVGLVVELRAKGFLGETGPPKRIRLKDIITGAANMHFSHRKGLCLTLKKEVLEMAKKDKEAAFALSEIGITK